MNINAEIKDEDTITDYFMLRRLLARKRMTVKDWLEQKIREEVKAAKLKEGKK